MTTEMETVMAATAPTSSSTDQRAANRPLVILGGWLSSPDDYRRMANLLARPPFNRIVYITDFNRNDWLKLRDPDFTPALEAVAATIDIARRETGSTQVDLIGHSAGGRVARAYLTDIAWHGRRYSGHRATANLITLGTAHSTSEIWVKQFADQLEQEAPGAFCQDVRYRAVAGRSVIGRRFGSLEEMLAYRSYDVSFGRGDLIGDGIVPTDACYLAGADNLILEGVRHAPYNAPTSWYGAASVVPIWFDIV
jgi:pimeloyl-ACP methyl ester carboxylesterase